MFGCMLSHGSYVLVVPLLLLLLQCWNNLNFHHHPCFTSSSWFPALPTLSSEQGHQHLLGLRQQQSLLLVQQ